ncbi:MAG: hypothetical protein K2Z25_19285 [Beijerinckiaceae bacterium]|nr:hypothetical protein [Beijerinckiaceae bacterium]
MSDHAHNLHLGASVVAGGLISAIMANDAARRVARQEAEAEATSVASVRRLAALLAATQRENAALRAGRTALQAEVEGLREDLACAHAALRRVL